MADQRTYPLLPDDKCLTEQQLFNYVDGKMTASEMHLAEKHLLDCAMCSDALEGFELLKNRNKVAAFFPGKTSNETEKDHEPKVIPLRPNRRSLYAIAAAIVLLFGITVVLRMNFSSDEPNSKLAEHVSKDSSEPAILDQENKVPAELDSVSTKNPADQLYEEKNADGKDQSGTPRVITENKLKSPAKVNQRTELEESKAVGMSTTTVPANNRADGDIIQQPVLADADAIKDKAKNDLYYDNSGTDDESKVSNGLFSKPSTDQAVDSKKEMAANETNNKSAGDSRSHTAKTNASGPPAAPAGNLDNNAPVAGGVTPDMNNKTDSTSTVIANSEVLINNIASEEKSTETDYDNGLQLMQNGKALDAIADFDKVLQNPKDKDFEDAQWQKALALIQLNRIDEAKVLLNDIVAKKGKHKKDAADKLKTL